MITRGILENLAVLFMLAVAMIVTFWWLLRMVNWSTGVKLKEVMPKIYENPIASAIYRGVVFYTVAQLVIAAFSRWI
jgi:hypothetical protein